MSEAANPAAQAVIVSAARTPIGRSRKGSLIGKDAFELAEVAIKAAVERSGVPLADIDDLLLAESMQGGGVIGRNVAMRLGYTNVPGASVNRHCAAGLTAVGFAAASIRAGWDQVNVAGGTESMSTAPMSSKPGPDGQYTYWMSPSHPPTDDAPPFDMAITVGENSAREAGLTRTDVDEWAAYSHANAIESIDKGYFKNEIVPVEITLPDGTTALFDTDEFPRRGVTVESLGQLKLLKPDLPGAVITAGNSAGINDAAAAVVLTSDGYAKANGLTPLATVRSFAPIAIEPSRTGMAPVYAIPKALARAGLEISDIDLYEINEAFCSVPVAAVRALGLKQDLVNVNGSGASLGHPIAATGARMVVTMVNELHRRGGGIGVVSMCAGGGMGGAMVLEVY
jgi:acetyl-CoA acetyltransferase family protein